jgi:hypothetical protein
MGRLGASSPSGSRAGLNQRAGPSCPIPFGVRLAAGQRASIATSSTLSIWASTTRRCPPRPVCQAEPRHPAPLTRGLVFRAYDILSRYRDYCRPIGILRVLAARPIK